MCLVCFIENKLQLHLREISQFQSDRFEHTLSAYKKVFLSHFKEYSEKKICENHKNLSNLNQRLKETISTDLIDEVFNNLINTYTLWIDAQTTESIKTMNDLFNKFNVLSDRVDITANIFFRGRFSDTPLSHWDMFHIPFNKRFLIKNQRYSLGGQPMLYFSFSPYGVFKELNIDLNDEKGTKDLKLTSFFFKNSSPKFAFDFRNTFEYIKETDLINMKSGEYINDDDATLGDILENIHNHIDESGIKTKIISMFVKMIVSSCCTFKSTVENNKAFFIEEYVLPQIVAQLTKRKFAGIIYTSSKKNDMISINSKLNRYIHLSSDNIALFTNYDHKQCDEFAYVYDRELYYQFDITAPISVDKDLQYLPVGEVSELLNDYSDSWCKKLMSIQSAQSVYILNSIPEKEFLSEYYELFIGKLHLIMLCNILYLFKHNYLYKSLG